MAPRVAARPTTRCSARSLGTNGVRSLTVQDFDPSSALWDVRRSGGIPDPRPVDVHPLSRAWARRRGAGCQDHLAIPEHLTRAGAVETLFARFDTLLRDKGYLAMSGQILDASLIPAPRQHLDDGEKAAIKDGESAAEIWPDQPAKAAQKDVDARWTVKHSRAKPVAEGEKAARHRHSGVRVQEPYRHRSTLRAYPYLAGERCSSPRWRSAARGTCG